MSNISHDRGERHEPERFESFGFSGVIAHRKLATGNDPTFRFLGWEATDDGGSILTGGQTRELTRGPRKGRRTYSGQKFRVVVTRAEEDAERDEYERTTGFCAACVGSGRQFEKWSKDHGTWYGDCEKCNGTGKAAQVVS